MNVIDIYRCLYTLTRSDDMPFPVIPPGHFPPRDDLHLLGAITNMLP